MERRIQKRHGMDYEIKGKRTRGSIREAKYLGNGNSRQNRERTGREVLTEKHKTISQIEQFRPVLGKINEKYLHQGIWL